MRRSPDVVERVVLYGRDMDSANRADAALERAQRTLLERCAPTAETRRIRWRGGETQVVELGEGPPLLLVHGGGDAGFEWFPLLEALAAHRRVIVVDRPGHGLADPFDYRGVDLLTHGAAFLGDVLDALGLETVDVAGNSMGGVWSLALALDEPQRVERLSLVGAPPGLTRSVPLLLRLGFGLPLVGRSVARRLLASPSREGSRAFWARLLVARPELLADEFLDVDVEHMRRNRESVVSLMCEVVRLSGVRRGLSLSARWRRLAVPTQALFGERDAFLSPRTWRAWETLASESAFVDLVRVPGAGHLPWLDEPERVLAELERFHAPSPVPERSTA